jgi:hypothetical protein
MITINSHLWVRYRHNEHKARDGKIVSLSSLLTLKNAKTFIQPFRETVLLHLENDKRRNLNNRGTNS